VIARPAKVRELIRRTMPDGTESCSVSVTFDEAGATTLRLSLAEHDEIAASLRGGKGFVVCLRLAPPTLSALAVPSTTEGSGAT
jgi:hypothetical protein